MEKYELTFNDIFKEDGLYHSIEFMDGYAIQIENGVFSFISWHDTFKKPSTFVLTDKMVNKYLYKKVYNRNQLFKNGQ